MVEQEEAKNRVEAMRALLMVAHTRRGHRAMRACCTGSRRLCCCREEYRRRLACHREAYHRRLKAAGAEYRALGPWWDRWETRRPGHKSWVQARHSVDNTQIPPELASRSCCSS